MRIRQSETGLCILGDVKTDHNMPRVGLPSSFSSPAAQANAGPSVEVFSAALADGQGNVSDLPRDLAAPEMPAMQPRLAADPHAAAAAVAGGWLGQAAWEQRTKDSREASTVTAANRAAAVATTAADVAAGDAANQLPGFLVDFMSRGYQETASNRQERWQEDVVVTVLEGLANRSSVTVLTAVLQHGWLPALSAIKERHSFSYISIDLWQGAAPKPGQQLLLLLLQQLANSSGPAAASAAKQARELMSYNSCAAGILAQQQHWQLLLRLLQHEEDTVVQTAVDLVARVVVRSEGRSDEPHVAETLLQMAEALQHGSKTAAKLFVKVACSRRPHRPEDSVIWTQMLEDEPAAFRLLLSLMPQLHAAGAAPSNSTSCRLAALQTLRVLCRMDESCKALVKGDCRWLLELVQPQETSVTTESAELAAAAAQVIKYIPCHQPGVTLLLSGNYTPQLLQVVLQHTEALQTASAQQRTHLRSCCKHIMEALSTLSGKQGGQSVIVKHMLLLLQAMQQCHDEAADIAGSIACECLAHGNVHKILQQQHVDILVRCLGSKHKATRGRATELLSDAAKKPQSCQMLLQPQTWDQLLAAVGSISGKADAAKIVDLTATALDHFFSMHSAAQVSEQLDEQVTPQHLEQLATAAVNNDTAGPRAAIILTQICAKGSWEMRLQLARVMPMLQKAVQQLQEEAEAARTKAEQMLAALGPGQPAELYMRYILAEVTQAEVRLQVVQPVVVQHLPNMIALAVKWVSGELAEARRDMHEVAGQFAEQYAAYRALRSQLSGSGFSATNDDGARLVADQAQLPAKRQRLGNISSSSSGSADLEQRKTQLQQQLSLRSDALVDALGELVAVADDVTYLQDLLQYAQ